MSNQDSRPLTTPYCHSNNGHTTVAADPPGYVFIIYSIATGRHRDSQTATTTQRSSESAARPPPEDSTRPRRQEMNAVTSLCLPTIRKTANNVDAETCGRKSAGLENAGTTKTLEVCNVAGLVCSAGFHPDSLGVGGKYHALGMMGLRLCPPAGCRGRSPRHSGGLGRSDL